MKAFFAMLLVILSLNANTLCHAEEGTSPDQGSHTGIYTSGGGQVLSNTLWGAFYRLSLGTCVASIKKPSNTKELYNYWGGGALVGAAAGFFYSIIHPSSYTSLAEYKEGTLAFGLPTIGVRYNPKSSIRADTKIFRMQF